MLRIFPLDIDNIDLVLSKFERSQLEYHEYKFLTDEQLKAYKRSSILKQAEIKENITLVAYLDLEPVGVITASKDSFDSEIFGFDCYKLYLTVFSDNLEDIRIIIRFLITETENYISSLSKKFYLSISLNNNITNSAIIFNCLTENSFYFIHTLLTFSSDNYKSAINADYTNNLIVREVLKSDVIKVSQLAKNSFQYSRFHMDPFLDNEKADDLLTTSAENSILNNFVDIMYVAELNGEVIGYYSGKKRFIKELNITIGDAVISAVDQKYRGMRIFTKMDDHLLNWFATNTDLAEMGTYLANYPIHKTWIGKKLKLIRGVYQFSKCQK